MQKGEQWKSSFNNIWTAHWWFIWRLQHVNVISRNDSWTVAREKKTEVERLAKENIGRKVAMLFTAPRHWLHKPQPYATAGHVYNMSMRNASSYWHPGNEWWEKNAAADLCVFFQASEATDHLQVLVAVILFQANVAVIFFGANKPLVAPTMLQANWLKCQLVKLSNAKLGASSHH